MKIFPKIDKYSLKARLYPAFIVLFPAFIVSVYYITDFEKYRHYATALASLGFLTFLLAQLGRDRGKKKETVLFNKWGGKPTTRLLRHSDNHLDPVTTKRYHELLSKLLTDMKLPTNRAEKSNIHQADYIYESCSKFLIAKTRDTEKFPLLFNENINYGFRRNLWGMKNLALLVLGGCIVVHGYLSTERFTTTTSLSAKDWVLLCFIILVGIFWIFTITKNWVHIPAISYAERLFETLEDYETNFPISNND